MDCLFNTYLALNSLAATSILLSKGGMEQGSTIIYSISAKHATLETLSRFLTSYPKNQVVILKTTINLVSGRLQAWIIGKGKEERMREHHRNGHSEERRTAYWTQLRLYCMNLRTILF
jgi:hypothetical protein